MKNIIIKNGLIASAIVVLFMVITTYLWKTDPEFKPGMFYGFSGMIIAFIFIFIGIKNYRDNLNNGLITFGKAFKIGFFIALFASTFYVLAWLILYYNFIPDFMDLYSKCIVDDAKVDGLSASQIQEKVAEIDQMREWYKSPILIILLTLMEILPVGILIALVSALILKRNTVKES